MEKCKTQTRWTDEELQDSIQRGLGLLRLTEDNFLDDGTLLVTDEYRKPENLTRGAFAEGIRLLAYLLAEKRRRTALTARPQPS
jgi:hypothetical protein